MIRNIPIRCPVCNSRGIAVFWQPGGPGRSTAALQGWTMPCDCLLDLPQDEANALIEASAHKWWTDTTGEEP